MRCAQCGFENAANAKICGECAAPLALVCPACGFENPPRHKFCGECAAPLAQSAATPADASAPVTPGANRERLAVRSEVEDGRVRMQTAGDTPPDGERKTVTALFADIKGSMDLMEDLDPEAARAVVDPALKLMIDAVHRYDGYIVQSTGDGIFALFGAPIAHEDHPQRALHAALRLQEEMRRYAAGLREAGNLPIEARVGVNTGEVVVRSIRTADSHTEYTPIGHSTSLAARMQALAPTGSIATTDHTRKLCEGYFAFKPLGPTRIKGVSGPVKVFEVIGPGALRTRLQLSIQRGLSRFVGRQAEMEVIKRALEQTIAGRGQIVAAFGEAGVGKSRLLHEFKAIARSGCLILETFSVSHGKASAYLPLIDLLKNYFQFSPNDDLRRRREKIAGKVLVLDRGLEDTLPYLYGLMGVVEGDDPLARMDPRIRQQRTLAGIKRILLRESLNQPLIAVFEDLHWIDAETQAFLNVLADSIGSARVLLLVNYRPEYRHEWGSKACYTQLRLDPLGAESAAQMLAALLGDSQELAALKQFIIEKTEGNPFFMEEMVQALFEEGVLARNGAVRLTKPAATVRVPPTVQGILTARIDRLPPREKELLQTLAVIGREFPLGLIEKIAATPPDELQAMLSNLQLAEFIYEQPAAPEVEYIFKHALTQEVAYNSVLIERRKSLHERIAMALETLFADRLEDHLADLAHHYGRSGNLRKAIEYKRLAASQATQRSSYGEAVELVNGALEMLAGLPESGERDYAELLLQVNLGASLMASKGFSSGELERACVRAGELARRLNNPIMLVAVLNGLWAFNFTRGNIKSALEIASELMTLATQLNDPGIAKDAHRAIGSALEFAGELIKAREHLQCAIAIGNVPRARGMSDRFGPDPDVLCLTALASVLYSLGYPDQALKRAYEAMGAVDLNSDPFSVAMAMVFAAQAHCLRGETAKGVELGREVVALCEEHGYPFWLSMGRRILGWALALQGQVKQGIELMESEVGRFTGAEEEMVRFHVSPSLAEAYRIIGDRPRAFALLDEWRAGRDRLNLTLHDAAVHNLRGRLLMEAGNYQEAEKSFRESMEIAAVRQAKSQELQAAINLARLLIGQGRSAEARPMLAKIYAWFTEGFDTRDLREAKSLLDELGG